MGPLRLIILAILLYIGYRLIVNSFKKSDDTGEREKRSLNSKGKYTDVLVEDPVCHKLVPQQQAISLKQDGQTHYFCSDECREKFVSEQGENK